MASLPQGQALALKAEITETLLEAKPVKMNLSESETRALRNLKKDDTIVITPADKGKALVVMDKDIYIQRMEEKFSDETTYKKIAVDPTQDIKEELIAKLKLLLRNNTIDEKLYDDLYPDVTQIPRAYGSPKRLTSTYHGSSRRILWTIHITLRTREILWTKLVLW